MSEENENKDMIGLNMKKYFKWPFIISITLCVCLALYLLCTQQGANEQENGKIIKIGAILPLTGDAADAGNFTKYGIELAVEEINQNGGVNGNSLVVIYEDSKADPKTGVSGVSKLINQDNVSYIIDNSISAVTLAVAPIVNKSNCILISTGASSPEITNAGKNIFRIWNSDNEEAIAVARYAIDSLKLDKILLIYMNDEYGNGLKNAFIKQTKDKIHIKDIGLNDIKDLSASMLNDVKQYNAVYIIGHSNATIQIIKRTIQNGFKGFFIGTSVMIDPNVQKELLNVGNDLFYPMPKSQSGENKEYLKFIELYKQKYKQEPVPLSDVGYDAVMLFYNGLTESKSKNKDIYTTIFNNFSEKKIYIGASGNVQFDDNGDVHKEINIVKLNKNK